MLKYWDSGMVKKSSNQELTEVRQAERQSRRVKVDVLVIRGPLERARALMLMVA
jgi:hypothetical protein